VGKLTVGSNPTPSAMETATGDDHRWMQAALDEARAALAHDDVPVGAVVIRDGRIIASRHNERELTGDPTAHAEILALRDAAAEIGHWRLDDCTLVVTLEPCPMCAGAMVNARLGALVFGASDPKAGAAGSCYDLVDSPVLNHRIPRISGVRSDECGTLLVDFFAARRRRGAGNGDVSASGPLRSGDAAPSDAPR
jgi:tRNA(adenine34) deaminase